MRDAIRDKLAAIKTIKYRDVDYETAKKEVMGYFRERGEAYPSEIEEDLELDYKLICIHGYRIRAEARKVRDPQVIAKTGRHKAQRLILTENAKAIIERKLAWIPER